jgi:hypothetical protein
MATASIKVHPGRLSPPSVGTVSLIQTGTDDLQQIELIQFTQNPYAFSNPANPLPSPGYAVEQVQVGTSGLQSVQRFTLDPLPYDGEFNLTYDGVTFTEVPFDISTKDLQTLVGANYVAAKKANNSWTLKKIANGAVNPITIDPAQLVVPMGVEGTLALNVRGIYLAFVGNTKKVLTLPFQVQLQFPGEDPRTIFADEVEVSRNIINTATLLSSTLLGYQTSVSALLGAAQFTWSNTISGLTTGINPLSGITMAEKSLGYRYDFDLNDVLNTFVLKADAADVDDPTGQVAGFDYDAGTNNKHWERQG